MTMIFLKSSRYKLSYKSVNLVETNYNTKPFNISIFYNNFLLNNLNLEELLYFHLNVFFNYNFEWILIEGNFDFLKIVII